MLAYVQWLNPQWGWVLPAAVLLPVVAHLLAGRGGRLALFPAVRFVKQAVARYNRRLIPRHWLLLLLRILILALIVGAFARPIWWQNIAAQRQGQGRSVVLIFDASASMQRTSKGQRLFDIARQQTLDTLAALDPLHDRVNVLVLDASPHWLLPRMTANLSALHNRLTTLEPTWQRGNLAAAINMTANPPWEDPANAPASLTQIHLFSDLQKTQWPENAQWREALTSSELHVHAIHGATANLALSQPHAQPATPVLGQSTTLSARVSNHGDQAQEAQVTMTVDGRPQTRSLQLGPNGQSEVRFNWRPTAAAVTPITFHLTTADPSADALAADNHTGLFVRPAVARRVALVTHANTDDPTQAAYYLKRALTPFTSTAKNQIDLAVWTPEQLPEKLRDNRPEMVVMVQTGKLSDVTLAALADDLNQGGGVWWVVDDPSAAASLLGWRQDDHAVSPIVQSTHATNDSPTKTSGKASGGGYFARGVFDDPVLGVFEGSLRTSVMLPRFDWTIGDGKAGSLILSADARGLFFDQHGQPVMAYRHVGRGVLAVLGAAMGPNQSDLVKSPVFLPLVQQLVRQLAPGSVQARPPAIGDRPSVVIPMMSGDTVNLQVRLPDGTVTTPVSAQIQPQADGLHVQLPVTAEPGPYLLYNTQNNHLLDGVQVDIDPAESDLTPISSTRIAQVQGQTTTAKSTSNGAAIAANVILQRHRLVLWPYLIACAAGLLVVESLVSGIGTTRDVTRRAAP